MQTLASWEIKVELAPTIRHQVIRIHEGTLTQRTPTIINGRETLGIGQEASGNCLELVGKWSGIGREIDRNRSNTFNFAKQLMTSTPSAVLLHFCS